MTLPSAKTNIAPEIMEKVLMQGDLSGLSAKERVEFNNALCTSLGLNPLTQPFVYIVLNGKLIPYPTKTCTDQLRKIHSVSLEIVSRDMTPDNLLLTVHVRAHSETMNRSDEDLGAVSFVYPARIKTKEGWKDHPKAGQPLSGEDRANAEMKAITKAKRRVTLSISGLGWADDMDDEVPLEAHAVPMIGPDALKPPETETKAEPEKRKPGRPKKDAVEEVTQTAAEPTTPAAQEPAAAPRPPTPAAAGSTLPDEAQEPLPNKPRGAWDDLGRSEMSLEDHAREYANFGEEAFKKWYGKVAAQEDRDKILAIGFDLRKRMNAHDLSEGDVS